MSAPTEQPGADKVQSELDELRARNAELEQARNASTARRVGRVARAPGSAALIVVGVVCLVVMPLAIWGRNLVLNTDRYVQTLTPIASNTGVQDAVISAVDRQVDQNLDVKAIVADVLPPRAQVLAAPLQSAVTGLVNTITTQFVRSKAFQTLWVEINRLAHQQINYLLTGKAPANAAVRVDSSGRVFLDLSKIVQTVKDRLTSAGLTVASKVPTVGATLEIANVHGLTNARKAVRLLNNLANWLPWIGLVLVAGGIAAARKRRRALMATALGFGAGMIIIGIGLLIGRNIYLNGIPTDKLPRDSAAFIFDTVVRYLRLGIRLLLLIALLVAFGSWVSSPSSSAVATRRFVTSIPRALGQKLNTGPVGPFVARYVTAFRVGIIVLAFIVLLLTDAPSLGTVIFLAVLAAVLLLLVEMFRTTAVRSRPTQ
jgi:LPXTG-motif cell wall-anchored protein